MSEGTISTGIKMVIQAVRDVREEFGEEPTNGIAGLADVAAYLAASTESGCTIELPPWGSRFLDEAGVHLKDRPTELAFAAGLLVLELERLLVDQLANEIGDAV